MTTNRKPDNELPPEAPPPWTLKGDMYWLVAKLPNPLPANVYHPLEAAAVTGDANDFKGGLCYIQIVRYKDSPVGPYDELALVPGVFKVPGGKTKNKSKMRVSRIYVNQKDTTYNGRKNWSIPKHLARFTFTYPTPGSSTLTISVYPPNQDTPFFKTTLKPSKWLPSFPVNTNYLPMDVSLVQPPIPHGEEPFEVGTESWKHLQAVFKSKCRVVWVESYDEEVERGDHWPMVKPWSFGIWMEGGSYEFGVPDEFVV